MKIHHIGIVCKEKDINKFFFSPKKKFIYYDKNQNNKLVIEKNPHNDLWMEFIIPKNNNSTVYKYLAKRGPGIHHFGYLVKNIEKEKQILQKKNGFIYVNSFVTKVSCFGGLIKTAFFYNNNFFIELLENVSKK